MRRVSKSCLKSVRFGIKHGVLPASDDRLIFCYCFLSSSYDIEKLSDSVRPYGGIPFEES